jgi:hypothetical protein
MTKDKFVKELNEAYTTANKLKAVKVLCETQAVGGLKVSKEFIDSHWYPSNKKSAGLNV